MAFNAFLTSQAEVVRVGRPRDIDYERAGDNLQYLAVRNYHRQLNMQSAAKFKNLDVLDRRSAKKGL